ncbi:uncharacterized protein LOC127255000 [Andrographis paniculata]|uniref:uncharacterized protein LOC127255000 n=1 Tax=Andrographis paniculata TaxID=175694 RepID=UPI0021E71A09|nr:uncharacterized protein LOC127255000 [Andrographis paniculata]
MAFGWLLNFANTIFVEHWSSERAVKERECGAAVEFGKQQAGDGESSTFKMPVHYPRYVKSDYEKMEEWRLDVLLQQYGVSFSGSLEEKRRFAMGAFLWPDQF